MDPNVLTAITYVVALAFTKNGQPATSPAGTSATYGLTADSGNLGDLLSDGAPPAQSITIDPANVIKFKAGEVGAAGTIAVSVAFPNGVTVRDSLQLLVGAGSPPPPPDGTPDAVKMTLTVEIPAAA